MLDTESTIDFTKRAKTKKEKRHQRQIDEIVDIVLPLIEERGFNNFTFNEVIQQCTISRTTFFNLIPTKEVIYTHMAFRGLDIWLDYSKRAIEYEASSRILLVGQFVSYYVFAKAHPTLHKAVFMHNYLPTDLDDHLDLTAQYDERVTVLTDRLTDIINLAIEKKEIKISGVMPPETLAMSLWHCVYGFVSRDLHNGASSDIERTVAYYRTYLRAVADLLQWKPLSSEYDYNAEMIKMIKLLFPKEALDFMTPALKEKLTKP